MPAEQPALVLASSSPFRRALLDRLRLDYTVAAPDIDEARQSGESPQDLVARLAEQKARAVAATHTGLVIGSDQVAALGTDILGKPGAHDQAQAQLQRLSGERVVFYTGLCLYDGERAHAQVDVVPFEVTFRALDDAQIERYLQAEQPYQCAGSFKSEGLGITLFEKMSGDDPTALIGLPLIRLTSMLANAGLRLP